MQEENKDDKDTDLSSMSAGMLAQQLKKQTPQQPDDVDVASAVIDSVSVDSDPMTAAEIKAVNDILQEHALRDTNNDRLELPSDGVVQYSPGEGGVVADVLQKFFNDDGDFQTQVQPHLQSIVETDGVAENKSRNDSDKQSDYSNSEYTAEPPQEEQTSPIDLRIKRYQLFVHLMTALDEQFNAEITSGKFPIKRGLRLFGGHQVKIDEKTYRVPEHIKIKYDAIQAFTRVKSDNVTHDNVDQLLEQALPHVKKCCEKPADNEHRFPTTQQAYEKFLPLQDVNLNTVDVTELEKKIQDVLNPTTQATYTPVAPA